MSDDNFQTQVISKLDSINTKVDKIDRTVHGEEGTLNHGLVESASSHEERLDALEGKGTLRRDAGLTGAAGAAGAFLSWLAHFFSSGPSH